ncbi:MAG: hypothetical protein HYS26_04775 [Candidatus Kaiserbacteria bacterium]|nr:MAG: hypothetical protein HYS26_04775 [Candidatus Kaiserbacteria bacterium]
MEKPRKKETQREESEDLETPASRALDHAPPSAPVAIEIPPIAHPNYLKDREEERLDKKHERSAKEYLAAQKRKREIN